jgi:hypothetical protein
MKIAGLYTVKSSHMLLIIGTYPLAPPFLPCTLSMPGYCLWTLVGPCTLLHELVKHKHLHSLLSKPQHVFKLIIHIARDRWDIKAQIM